MAGQIKEMVCVGCRAKISQTIRQAKAHGWSLWVGGAMCPTCSGGKPEPLPAVPREDSAPSGEYDQHHSMGLEVVDGLKEGDDGENDE